MSAPFLDSVAWFVPLSVAVAGLIGSPHCIAMCGPISLAVARTPRGVVFYQIGRGLSYLAAGAFVGAIGETALGGLAPAWAQAAGLLVIALVLIVTGFRALAGASAHLSLPGFLARRLERALDFFWKRVLGNSLGHQPPPANFVAFAAGSFSALLPCGHLYGFLLGAAATGSALRAMLFMLAFWFGTMPAMVIGLRWVAQILSLPRLPRWAGGLLVVAGLFSLLAFASRLPLTSSAGTSPSTELICH